MTTSTRRITAPAVFAVTLNDALAHLREEGDGGSNDALVEACVAAAHGACEDRTERALITSTWRLTRDGFPAASTSNPLAIIELRRPPVLSVVSVKYDDAAGVEQTLAGAAYRVDLASEPARLMPVPGTVWPATLAGAIATVRVEFTAGYGASSASVPEPLRQWVLLAVGDLYERRAASGETPATPHAFVDGLLQPYRQLGV